MSIASECRVLSKRYYFQVVGDGSTLEDDEGTVLSGPEAARLQAAVIAAELAQELVDYCGFLVCVMDEEGNELARVPVTGIGDITGSARLQ